MFPQLVELNCIFLEHKNELSYRARGTRPFWHFTQLILQVDMANFYNCTFMEAISQGFIVKQLIKQVIGVMLLLLYVRLIYILIRDREQFNNAFYRLVIMNGCSVCAVSKRSNQTSLFSGLRLLLHFLSCE